MRLLVALLLAAAFVPSALAQTAVAPPTTVTITVPATDMQAVIDGLKLYADVHFGALRNDIAKQANDQIHPPANTPPPAEEPKE